MSDLKSWEEMSDLERAACTYWDMYKDAHGVRPRGIDTSTWTLEQFDREFASLGQVIEAEEAQRRESEASASLRVEKAIATLIRSGAQDRVTAIRWLHESHDTQGDDEYLCFQLGLPYGYFNDVLTLEQ
jgi:hypothetical protein